MTKLFKLSWQWLLFMVLLSCWGVREVQAQGVQALLLTAETDEVALGRQVAYLEDVTGQMTVADVLRENGRFQPLAQDTPNFGFTSSAYWFRVKVQLEVGERPSTWWLEIHNATLNQIDLYLLEDNNNFSHQQTGSILPHDPSILSHNFPVFVLNLVPGAERTFYVRVVENAAFIVPMTLFSNEAFLHEVQNEQIFLGLNYGVLLVMLVYNLIIYFYLRQRSYLYYVIFIAAFILGQASNDGLTRQYLWPSAGQWSDLTGFFFAPLTISAFLYFTDEFLQARHTVPRFHALKQVLVGLWVLLLLLIPFVAQSLLTPLLLLLLIVSVAAAVVAGFGARRWGYELARIYLLAWSVPLLSVIIFALTQLGTLPFSLWTQQSPRIGIVFMVTLLSVALANQIHVIRRQKEAALAQAEELNEVLEKRVMERTAELAASNHHLTQLIAEREQGEASLRRQTSQLEALQETALEIMAELEMPALLQSIITRAAELVKTSRGGLALWLPERNVLEMVTVADPEQVDVLIGRTYQPGEGLVGSVWLSGQPLIVQDYTTWTEKIDAIADNIVKTAVIGVPLHWQEEPIGVLTISDRSGRCFTEGDVELLTLFAVQAAVAIQNARLLAQIQHHSRALEAEIFERRHAQDIALHYHDHLEDLVAARTAELETVNQKLAQHNQVMLTLHKASLAVTSSLDLPEVLNMVTRGMAQLLAVTTCDVLIWAEQERTMTMVAGYRPTGQLLAEEFETYDLTLYPLSERVMVEKRVVQMTINQTDLDPGERAYMEAEGVQTLVMIPIVFHDHSLGMVTLEDHFVERVFTEDEVFLGRLFSYQAANAIENARYYEQARQLIAELETKNAELERFTYTVSHDLKSPLVTVEGFVGFLEKDVREGNMERVNQDVARIREAANKMEQLLHDLLALSRIGRLMNPPRPIAFNDLVAEALTLVGGSINKGHVEVVVMPDMPIVLVDRPRLVEVLQNLLENGIKFMGDQPQPRIEIGMQVSAGITTFFVRDNGVGIAPQYHDKVFGLFDRLDSTVEGTGIGLALVKRIVEVHNGRIWIETSSAEPGTTFCFTLPLA